MDNLRGSAWRSVQSESGRATARRAGGVSETQRHHWLEPSAAAPSPKSCNEGSFGGERQKTKAEEDNLFVPVKHDEHSKRHVGVFVSRFVFTRNTCCTFNVLPS